jgi:chromosome segregation ATPase
VKALKKSTDDQVLAAEALKCEIVRQREKNAESELLLTERIQLQKNVIEDSAARIHELQAKRQELVDENLRLHSELEAERSKVVVLEAQGDVQLLRVCLDSCAKLIDKQSGPLLELPDPELCTTFQTLLNHRLEEPCKRCLAFEFEIEGMVGRLQELTNSGEDSPVRLCQQIKDRFREYDETIAQLRTEIQDGKVPVIDAIKILSPSSNSANLAKKSVKELEATLRQSLKQIYEQQQASKDSILKREEQYLKTFSQIDLKLLEVLKRSPSTVPIIDDAAAERKRVIESISHSIKSLQETINLFEGNLRKSETQVSEAQEKLAAFANEVRTAMEISPSLNVIETCANKMSSMKQLYEREITSLRSELDTSQADIKAIEIRIAGICQRPGTAYETLSRLQDEKEESKLEIQRIQNKANKYRACIEAVAEVVLTSANLIKIPIEQMIKELESYCRDPQTGNVANIAIGDILAKVYKRMGIQDMSKPLVICPIVQARLQEFLDFQQTFVSMQQILYGFENQNDEDLFQEIVERPKIAFGKIAIPTGMEYVFKLFANFIDELTLPVEPPPNLDKAPAT